MRGPFLLLAWIVATLSCLLVSACGPRRPNETRLTISGSAVGAEAELLDRQLRRFMQLHPGLRVERQVTPDAGGQRHQLYVQWLAAHTTAPDVLQLDVVWTPEFAAAGWVLPLDSMGPDVGAFFKPVIDADRWGGKLYALPWFVDVGMLYWRSDLMERPPSSLTELSALAHKLRDQHGLDYGLVWQNARYEGLVCTFLEVLGGFGGQIIDDEGHVQVDSEAGRAALTFMRDAIHKSGIVPERALGWHEEETRLSFQNGQAVFMRNWPYAYSLMQDAHKSRVAGRFKVAPMPAAKGGTSSAALGGQQLAINARSQHPREAYELIRFLTAPEQLLERAEVAGQYPPRPALYDDPRLAAALAAPPSEVRRIIEHALPRPATPLYAELSEILQIELHRALSAERSVASALDAAASQMRKLLADRAPRPTGSGRLAAGTAPAPDYADVWLLLGLFVCLTVLGVAVAWRRDNARLSGLERRDAQLGRWLVLPAIGAIFAIAILPLLWTVSESLHEHDLRMPWRGRPFVGLEHYGAALTDGRFWGALGNTALFALATVTLEMVLGLVLALALNRAFRGRGLVRALVMLPWAIPTVVTALVWRFLFEPTGLLNNQAGAWLPVILGDVWKTTPFVALLLLAGLQSIDAQQYEAARIDGAGFWGLLFYVTLPLLGPAILVALVFRSLDAFRVFDLIYVLTGGGPGTATEPLSLYSHSLLFQSLRFGYGSAISLSVFVVTFALAVVYIRLLGGQLLRGQK